jgi:hypothetical protein
MAGIRKETMPTLGEMIDEVRANLQGYALRQDRISYVTNSGGISATSSNITIGSASNLAKGVIEIDDELLWIDTFDKASNTLTVAPGFGRGYQGTTPTPHAQYAQITLSPTFPRSSIKKAINDTINSYYPKLWSVSSTTFTFNASQTTYPLPDDAETILFMSWQTTGSSQEWLPINRWRADPMANAATFNTTTTVSLYENIQPGRTVQVWYTTEPNTLDANSDDYSDVTGLPASSYDVTVLGASYKLLSFLDAGRINLSSAEADLNDTKNPFNSGASASRYIFALYQQRLQEEALKLADKYPIRLHYTK